MPEDIVPTIEGQILRLLSSVMDDFIPNHIEEHGKSMDRGNERTYV
jgi:hypothetical protein